MQTRGKILHLKPWEVVARGYSAISQVLDGRPIGYCLKDFNGGTDPEAKHPAVKNPAMAQWTADCIGFVLWASGIDRKQPDYHGSLGEWLNCKSLLDDAHGAQRFCWKPPAHDALPGDWLLTPDHIGLIVRTATKDGDVLVIDCSPRHGRTTAINTGLPWSAACQVIRPLFYA